jgi:hypothetical protein
MTDEFYLWRYFMKRDIHNTIDVVLTWFLAIFIGGFLMMGASMEPAYSADSTSFNPLNVSIKAKGSSVPIGTVVAWPVSSNPPDWDNWLECNGQGITQAAYPELYALIGGTIPDYRGLFLRGVGGQSGAINVYQGDSVHLSDGDANMQIGGKLDLVQIGVADNSSSIGGDSPYWEKSLTAGYAIITGRYSFYDTNVNHYSHFWDDPLYYVNNGNFTGELPIKITGTGDETRPVNKAVRYLIRAKP